MDEIKGIARVKFHPGKVEEWKRLTEEAMEIVRTRDTGTLQYEIFFNEDETEATCSRRGWCCRIRNWRNCPDAERFHRRATA